MHPGTLQRRCFRQHKLPPLATVTRRATIATSACMLGQWKDWRSQDVVRLIPTWPKDSCITRIKHPLQARAGEPSILACCGIVHQLQGHPGGNSQMLHGPSTPLPSSQTKLHSQDSTSHHKALSHDQHHITRANNHVVKGSCITTHLTGATHPARSGVAAPALGRLHHRAPRSRSGTIEGMWPVTAPHMHYQPEATETFAAPGSLKQRHKRRRRD